MDNARVGQKVLYVHDDLIYTVQEARPLNCIIYRERPANFVQTRIAMYEDLQDASPGTIIDFKAQLEVSRDREKKLREALEKIVTEADRVKAISEQYPGIEVIRYMAYLALKETEVKPD